MNKLLASSVDSKQLSLVVKGALTLVVPLAAVVIKAAGGEVSNNELEAIVDLITDLVFFIGSFVSLGTMLYGALRKIYNSLK